MFMPDSDSKYSRKPAAVVKPLGASDCAKIIKFASEHKLLISIRAGGHNVAGSSLCDGGLVINLRAMNQTVVDIEKQTATTGGGTIWAEFFTECYACGLGTTGGVVSETGVAGLTVGGGVGYLRTKHGMTIDNVLSMQVVTADGKIQTCNKRHNPDLFYALRGGGGGYALVTSFTLQLHPIPKEHWTVMWVWDLELMPKIIPALQEFISSGEDEEMALMAIAWPVCGIPHPELQGKAKCLIAGGYVGDKDRQEVYQKVKDFIWSRVGVDGIDLSHPAPFDQWNMGFDFYFPMGTDHAYWSGAWVTDITADLANEILDVITNRRPKEADKGIVAFWTTYGKMLRPDDMDVAFSKRHAGAFVSFDTTWTTGGSADEACIEYTRAGANVVKKYADGAYLQWAGFEDERKAISTTQYEDIDKLIAIKKKYDPDNVFPSWIKG